MKMEFLNGVGVLGCPVNMFQDEREITWLAQIVEKLRPRHVLEIGSLLGGTLWLWMRYMPEGGHIVSVDMLVSHEDNRSVAQRWGHDLAWEMWASERNLMFDVIETSSQEQKTLYAVERIMPWVNFLFIDGNHGYEAVKRDYELYSPLVRKGGIIAFHDIDFEKDSPFYGVKPLWEQIKSSGRDCLEFIAEPGQYGIGVVRV